MKHQSGMTKLAQAILDVLQGRAPSGPLQDRLRDVYFFSQSIQALAEDALRSDREASRGTIDEDA